MGRSGHLCWGGRFEWKEWGGLRGGDWDKKGAWDEEPSEEVEVAAEAVGWIGEGRVGSLKVLRLGLIEGGARDACEAGMSEETERAREEIASLIESSSVWTEEGREGEVD